MSHCFNISKHIYLAFVFHNFYLMFCGFFAGFLKRITRGWDFSTILLPQGLEFRTFFVPGGEGGNLPFQKNPGGMVRLGIDWYLKH